MEKLRVLVSLHKGYGLGDGTQMSAVLRHVAKYRPNWTIDYQADRGKEVVGRGIVDNVFAYGEPHLSSHYDAEVLICLYDTFSNWHDRPDTRVSACLHEYFDLGWDVECGRYRVNVRPEAVDMARTALFGHKNQATAGLRHPGMRFVAVHYQGDSAQQRKNLSHEEVDAVCQHVERLGAHPLILDWRGRSPLPYRKLRAPALWGRDAEMVSAVVGQCAAFVGIDSGPAKCAAATDTPSLVVWHGHHPACFFDPAPNVVHLAPDGYRGAHPKVTDPAVVAWFEARSAVRKYGVGLVAVINRWLEEVLA